MAARTRKHALQGERLSYANLDIRSIKTSENIPKGDKNGKLVNFQRLLDNHGPILGPRLS